MTKPTDTDLAYAMLYEGKMDAMFLPAGAIAWLWQYQRPEMQTDAAIFAAATASRAGNPVADAALLRADHNVLVLHLQNGETVNVYPDGGYGSKGEPLDRGSLESFVQGMLAMQVAAEPEPTVELPPEVLA